MSERAFEVWRASAATSRDGVHAYRLRVYQAPHDLTLVAEEHVTSHTDRAQVLAATTLELTGEERRWLIEQLLKAERIDRERGADVEPASDGKVQDFAAAMARRDGR